MTLSASVSRMVIVLSFSLLMKAVPAAAGWEQTEINTANPTIKRTIVHPEKFSISLLAFRFRLVVPERIRKIFRMQKALLRRNGNKRTRTDK
jgi:hypothetical protein